MLTSPRALAAMPFAELDPSVRRAVRVDISSALLLTMFMALTAPFVGLVLRRQLGATPFQISIVATAAAVSMLLGVVWARVLRGRTPLPYVVWAGVAARGLLLLAPFVHSSWGFVALLSASTFVWTAAGPAQAALIERVYPRPQRGRALSLVRTAAALLAIPFVQVAGRLFDIVDYRWLFFAAGAIGVASSLRLLAMPVPPADAPASDGERPRSHIKDSWMVVVRDRSFRALMFTTFLFGLGCWIQEPANPLLLADILRVSATQLAWIGLPGSLLALGASACWGRLCDRRTSVETLRLVWLCGALSPCIAYVATTPWVYSFTSLTNAMFGPGLEIVATLVVIDAAGPRRAAQYAAIAATFAGIRGIVGPLLGVLIIETLGVRAVYLVAACMMFAAVGLLIKLGAPRALRRSSVALLDSPAR